MSASTQAALVVPLALGLWLTGPAEIASPAGDRGAAVPTPHAEELREVVVEPGTEIQLELRSHLSTSSSARGDRFRARVTEPVVVGSVVAIPVGTSVTGRVASVREPGRSDRAGIELEFREIRVDGRRYDLSAVVVDADHEKSADPNSGEKAKKIGGGAAAGALLGAVVGDGVKGALIGGAAGAAAGSIIYAGTRGKKLTLPVGTKVRIETDERMRIEREI